MLICQVLGKFMLNARGFDLQLSEPRQGYIGRKYTHCNIQVFLRYKNKGGKKQTNKKQEDKAGAVQAPIPRHHIISYHIQ